MFTAQLRRDHGDVIRPSPAAVLALALGPCCQRPLKRGCHVTRKAVKRRVSDPASPPPQRVGPTPAATPAALDERAGVCHFNAIIANTRWRRTRPLAVLHLPLKPSPESKGRDGYVSWMGSKKDRKRERRNWSQCPGDEIWRHRSAPHSEENRCGGSNSAGITTWSSNSALFTQQEPVWI